MAGLNTAYLQTNRGVIKLLEIIFGFIVCSLLCVYWYGGRTCFYEGRIGFVSGLNFIIVIINVVLFVLNLLSVENYKMERIYSVVGTVLFIIAFAIMIWVLIQYDFHYGQYIASTILIGIIMGLFIWDYQILHGQAFN
ncbi:hypothetical protein Mgra_00009959 [Meloidogyne graminicola]|uniref:MARVEL domain-containing protein n=1 Tax=Meloidogyne graminicola TaxID=189291 RepID=A0A8S9ZCU8_9BILA|nr:hypothetical protein Mgra_00009959 [Meloidogyne graminicola]